MANSYTDTPSQRERQHDGEVVANAAERTRRRAESTARIRAVHAARQADTLARRVLEERGNYAAVKTGTDYERFVANVLAGAGIAAVRVGGSGDYGADLLVETAAGKAVIQCKFYTRPVGYDAVKEAYTAKAIYKASAAFVVSNAAFTTQARRAARRLGVTLTNHAEIAGVFGTNSYR